MIAHCFSFSRCGFVLVKVPEEQGPAVAAELVARPGERAHSPPPPATPPGVELHGEMHCTAHIDVLWDERIILDFSMGIFLFHFAKDCSLVKEVNDINVLHKYTGYISIPLFPQ